MNLKFFWQDKCPNCHGAETVIDSIKNVTINKFNINDVDGMAEAAFHSVMGTPTTILVDDDTEVYSWRSMCPSASEIMSRL